MNDTDVVGVVPFETPDGLIRDLRVTPPPAGLVLLPDPDAPRADFVAAGKATRVFVIRLLSFRLYVSVLRHTARRYAADGSLATAVGQDASANLGMFATVKASQYDTTPGVGEEYEFEGMRFSLVNGHDLHGLQLQVTASCQHTRSTRRRSRPRGSRPWSPCSGSTSRRSIRPGRCAPPTAGDRTASGRPERAGTRCRCR